MNQALFATLYIAAGATLTTWVHWRDQQRPPWPAIIGLISLWPLVLICAAAILIVERIVGGSFREWRS